VATVSTVALVTIGYLIGEGGLGNLIDEGFNNDFKAEVFYASVLCVVIALVLDALIVGIQRAVLPWTRRRG
jgi:osmoprotectant transport system permease protein